MARGKNGQKRARPPKPAPIQRPAPPPPASPPRVPSRSPSPPPRDEREAIADIAERLAYIENNSLDIAALVAVLFRLNDAYAERENAFLSEWEDYLTSELRQSFCVGHHGAFEDLEREGWRGGKPDRPDSWFPPQVLRQKEERWEEVAKQQFEEKGDLVRQEAGETFVECMERAAQMVRDKEKQDTSLKKANTVFVEPGFITSEDWTSHFKQRGFARGIDFAPFKPELIVLHSREDGMVGWAPAKFVFTTSGYEDQGLVPLTGADDDQAVTGSHDWTQEVEQSIFEQLFDRLPQWLELPSQAECDWRDRALRDDPDRGKCPRRPSDRIKDVRRKQYGTELVDEMLFHKLQEQWSAMGLGGSAPRLRIR
ncbi:hypothetical protein NBRC10513_006531 [Rhodotorula toruloides]